MNHLFFPSSIIVGAHCYAIVWLGTLTRLSSVKQGFGLCWLPLPGQDLQNQGDGDSECLLNPPFRRATMAQRGAQPLRAFVPFLLRRTIDRNTQVD
jgi:hypothetical protein